MSWRNFACIDMGSILFVSGKINSQSYQRILKSHLLPNAGFLAGENLKFQPGNAPVHMSNGTKLWFLVNSVETWKWPVKSPDFNPIKNIWGNLVKRVYENKRHFMSSVKLKTTTEDEWYKREPELCQKLVSFMKNKIFEVIRRNGFYTSF